MWEYEVPDRPLQGTTSFPRYTLPSVHNFFKNDQIV